ncbi:V-type proton ATPase subunit H [Sesamum angolense]|uniref:Vacuolar proton pump subunit H n=1 Tax=Sesamum angolense TaxID=2727404 RepID=A0AAE1T4I2_9LAMI|nr:V-type proton ATPase subunit H [Sesamum angolense]
MPIDQGELSTDEVLRRDIPWETYMTTKLITGTGLQLLRRYDKKPENYKAQLLDALKTPSHPSRGIPIAINCLATLLKEPMVRSSFVQSDGVKLLIPLISPASTQQSIQLLYETCLCVWLLSYYEPAIEYLATSRSLPRLIEVVKGSTKEKVVRVVALTLRNLLHKGSFGAQMVDLGLLLIVQNLKAQAWSDEDLLEALNQLEEGLKDNIKKLSSFDKYKQEVLLGHLDWSPMHKDPTFWRENITNFEEHDFQILRVLITILDTSTDARTLAVACYDLSQFIQYHSAGRIIVNDLKAKDRVMKLMDHENTEVTKNALLCIQRLFLERKKYPSCLYCLYLLPTGNVTGICILTDPSINPKQPRPCSVSCYFSVA